MMDIVRILRKTEKREKKTRNNQAFFCHSACWTELRVVCQVLEVGTDNRQTDIHKAERLEFFSKLKANPQTSRVKYYKTPSF